MEAAQNKKAAVMFKALGDENRLLILQQLRQGEKCACRLLDDLAISQPTLSHHMKLLCDTGLVTARREGKWMHYSLSTEGILQLQRYLESMIK